MIPEFTNNLLLVYCLLFMFTFIHSLNYSFIHSVFQFFNVNFYKFTTAITLEDEGTYTCVAQNPYGKSEASAFVSVTGIGMLTALIN